MEEAENNQNEMLIQNKVYQGRRKSISKKKKIDSFVCRENTNVEQAETQIETTKIINECHIDVDCLKNEKETSRDTGNQTVEHHDANEDTGNTDLAFDDIRDEQNNDDSELSNNVDGKSQKNLNDFLEIINIEDSELEKEEFDFGGDTDNEEKYDPKKDANYKGGFYKSPYELKPVEPKMLVSASKKPVTNTLFAMLYKPREIVFETYKGFKVLAFEMETLAATGLDVHYEVINAWSNVLNTIGKDIKDDDKTLRKYCFKTKFLHFYVICFDLQSSSFVLIENNCVENDSADIETLAYQKLWSYEKLRCAKLEVDKLDFKKRNDRADCEIVVMTAMDCYVG
nr:hypothetical protein [Tanacetum cinerariifolium]